MLADVLERLDVATCQDLFQVHLHQQRYDFTSGLVQKSDHVLEVGTGLGVFSGLLSRQAALYRGIEYDETTCLAAKMRVPDPEWITRGDAQALEFEAESFDVVVCLELLEHLPDYRKALDEIVRVLRPGGRLLASIPYVRNGAPSAINPHHLYEPGEEEFKREINGRFPRARFFYQRYSESAFETCVRKLRLRRLFRQDRQYALLTQGEPHELEKISLDESRNGMLMGLFTVATKPAGR